jgi:uncharacterized DUF497 family protein
MQFRWNEWNLEHIAKHGISPEEAEAVVQMAVRPYPRKIEEGKWLAWGRGSGGRFLQVIFLLDDAGVVDVIHARPLIDQEKRRYRRERKR